IPRAGAPGRGRAPAAAGRRATLGGTETARPMALIPLEEAVAARYSARELLERTLDAGSCVSWDTAPVDVEAGPEYAAELGPGRRGTAGAGGWSGPGMPGRRSPGTPPRGPWNRGRSTPQSWRGPGRAAAATRRC